MPYFENKISPFMEEQGLDPSLATSYPSSLRSKTPIIYSCKCGEIVERATFLKLKARPFCSVCVSDETIYFEKYLLPVLERNNLDKSKVTSWPKNAHDKTLMIYECVCGEGVQKTDRLFKSKPLCNTCMPKAKTGKKAPTIDTFEKMLKDNGCGFVNIEEAKRSYKNTKSHVEIVNSSGYVYTTTYNRFQQGHRSVQEANEGFKVSIEDVKAKVKEAGFEWIPGTKYVNNKELIPMMCRCGEKAFIALSNLSKDRVGCKSCYRYMRKYSWSYIEGFADRYNCTIVSCDYKGRDSLIELICTCSETMIKNIRGFLKSPKCTKCSSESRKKTLIEKYGTDNFFSSELGKEKVRGYWIEKYGVDHNMKVPEIQEKAQKTCMENHGVKCILSTEEVRKKAIEAHIAKWGAPPGFVKEIQEKGTQTTLDRYGNRCFLQSESGKALMAEKYGAPHALQVPIFFEKAMKSAFRMKEYVFPSGRVDYLQGYENMCVDYYIKNGIAEDNIVLNAAKVPEVTYTFEGKKKRYFMDMYIPSKDVAVEVKSEWTFSRDEEKNVSKWKAASLVCKGGCYVHIFEKKNEFIVTHIYMDGKEVTGVEMTGNEVFER